MKELFIKLADKLGRDPTDEEMTDAYAQMIDNAMLVKDEELLSKAK